MLNNYWGLGAFCRTTKKYTCILTRNRKRVDFESFIWNNINAETTIMSDMWRGIEKDICWATSMVLLIIQSYLLIVKTEIVTLKTLNDFGDR